MNSFYVEGRAAAKKSKERSACPYGNMRMTRKFYWLAGWHDWHIENKTGVYY